MNNFHTPVLQSEVLKALKIKRGAKYIDATIGGGGHAVEILKHGGKVLGIDVDEDAIEYLERKFKIGEDVVLVKGNFKDLREIARSQGFSNVAGVIFDLGISSHQLNTRERGFSFRLDALLDMRMDQSLQVRAKELVNGLTKGELYELFTKLGQENRALAISDRIVRTRKVKPIETTGELAAIVSDVYGLGRSRRIHPATKVFQAIRIAVNDELNNIRVSLPEAFTLLESGGRMVVVSFHSLEDRIVKKTFQAFEEKGIAHIITKKPVRPKLMEIEQNARARSAKMRVIEKN